MDITVARRSFQAVEHVAEILAQVILDERAGLELQCAEVANGTQFGREVDFRPGKKLPERGIVRGGRGVFFLHQSGL